MLFIIDQAFEGLVMLQLLENDLEDASKKSFESSVLINNELNIAVEILNNIHSVRKVFKRKIFYFSPLSASLRKIEYYSSS